MQAFQAAFRSALARRRRWILVTGVPRGGTTFVGRVFAFAPHADYLHEPFNPDCGLIGVDRHFITPVGEDAAQTTELVDQLLGLRGRMRRRASRTGSPKLARLRRRIPSRNSLRYMKVCHDPRRRTVIVKDPLGCMLAEYLAVEHGVQSLAIVRHPLDVLASHRRLRWNPDIAQLLSEEGLIYGREPDELSRSALRGHSWETKAAAYWRVITGFHRAWSRQHDAVRLCCHEDLCVRPVYEFRRLFADFGLNWGPHVERRLRGFTESKIPVAPEDDRVHRMRRNSQMVNGHGVRVFSKAERREIFEQTWEVAKNFYPRESFALDG